MKRVYLVILFLGTTVCFYLPMLQAAENTVITNADLANVFFDLLELKIQENTDNLSKAELFKIQANILAQRGVSQFMYTKTDEILTRREVANLLYNTIEGSNNATIKEKINYLAREGYIFAGGENDLMPLIETNLHPLALLKAKRSHHRSCRFKQNGFNKIRYCFSNVETVRMLLLICSGLAGLMRR